MIELDTIWSAFLREIDGSNFNDYDTIRNNVAVIEFAVNNLFVFDDSSAMIQVHVLINFFLRKSIASSSLKILGAFFELCIKLMRRLNIDLSKFSEDIQRDDLNELTQKFCQNLLSGTCRANNQEVHLLLISSAKIITSQAYRFDDLSDDIQLKNEIFSKLSALLLTLLEQIGVENEIGFETWLSKVLHDLGSSHDIDLLRTRLEHIQQISQFWTVKYAEVCTTLIGMTLPFLWKTFTEHSSQKFHLCTLMTNICHLFPNDADIYFAKKISNAIRNKKFETIESFTKFWDLSVSSQLLENVPLRISVLILVDSMTRDDFKFRKCSSIWIFSISKHLDRFLVPSLSSFIDILECGLNEAFNSTSSSKKAFRKNFDKDPLIYFLNLIERLLTVNYDVIHNYLTITDINTYLVIQMSAFIELIKCHLNIDLDFDYSMFTFPFNMNLINFFRK